MPSRLVPPPTGLGRRTAPTAQRERRCPPRAAPDSLRQPGGVRTPIGAGHRAPVGLSGGTAGAYNTPIRSRLELLGGGMPGQNGWVVVGVDNGGTANNGTALDAEGHFLIDRMAEIPSYVRQGPDKAVQALVDSVDHVLELVDLPRSAVRAVGLDTPGRPAPPGCCPPGARPTSPPRSGGTLTSAAPWKHSSACRWSTTTTATRPRSTPTTRATATSRDQHSSVSAIVGTGLGGGVVESGRVVGGAAGMAGELGHVPSRWRGCWRTGSRCPPATAAQLGDVESVASLTAIEQNLLPYWLTRFTEHAADAGRARWARRPSWSAATARAATRWR